MIGLPGDTIEMIQGSLVINGKPVQREQRPAAMIPIDDNIPCTPDNYGDQRVTGRDGALYCQLPVVRETLPNGRTLRHDRHGL